MIQITLLSAMPIEKHLVMPCLHFLLGISVCAVGCDVQATYMYVLFRALVYTRVSHTDFFVHGVIFSADQSKQRREVVRRKTAEYLKHAEELYQKHLAEEKEEVCVVFQP